MRWRLRDAHTTTVYIRTSQTKKQPELPIELPTRLLKRAIFSPSPSWYKRSKIGKKKKVARVYYDACGAHIPHIHWNKQQAAGALRRYSTHYFSSTEPYGLALLSESVDACQNRSMSDGISGQSVKTTEFVAKYTVPPAERTYHLMR